MAIRTRTLDTTVQFISSDDEGAEGDQTIFTLRPLTMNQQAYLDDHSSTFVFQNPEMEETVRDGFRKKKKKPTNNQEVVQKANLKFFSTAIEGVRLALDSIDNLEKADGSKYPTKITRTNTYTYPHPIGEVHVIPKDIIEILPSALIQEMYQFIKEHSTVSPDTAKKSSSQSSPKK